MKTPEQVRDEAAAIADGSFAQSKAAEAASRDAAEKDTSTAGREVEMEYAVSYARRASAAAGIATAIRAIDLEN